MHTKLRAIPYPSKEEAIELFVKFLDTIINLPSCLNEKRRMLKCNCLWQFVGQQDWLFHIAKKMVDSVYNTRPIRDSYFQQQICTYNILGRTSKLPVPAIGKPESLDIAVCHYAFLQIMGIGKSKYSTLLQANKN